MGKNNYTGLRLCSASLHSLRTRACVRNNSRGCASSSQVSTLLPALLLYFNYRTQHSLSRISDAK